MGSRSNSGPLSYFPGDVQIVNATVVATTTIGDATGTSDPGALPAGNAGAPADNDRVQINSATQIGTAAQNRRLSVFGPVFFAGSVTFTKAATSVITIDGRTTPHTSLTDFVEQFRRGAGSAAGEQVPVTVDVESGAAGAGQLTVNTDRLTAVRVLLNGGAGDVAPGGGSTLPNFVGMHITGGASNGGAARFSGIILNNGADGIVLSPGIGFNPDNAIDVGLSVADAAGIGTNRLRPRSIYAGTSVIVGASTTITTDTITIGGGAAAGIVQTSQTTDANGQALTVRASDGFAGGAASRAGGTLNLTAGRAAAGGAGAAIGGTIAITAGDGVAVGVTAGAGGPITITAGAAASAGAASVVGADITITAGAAASGAGATVGGNVIIRTGAGAAGGALGAVIFRNVGATATPDILPRTGGEGLIGTDATPWAEANFNSGVDIIVTGEANPRLRLFNTGTVGSILFGPGGATALRNRIMDNGAAGSLLIDANGAGATTIQLGTTGSTGLVESVDEGLTVRTRRVAAGSGSQLSLTAANAVGAGAFAGGAILLTAGTGIGTGAGGSITAQAGVGAVGAGGNGGSVNLTTGAAGVGSAGRGGDVVVTTGPGDGAGRRGVMRPGVDNQDDIGVNEAAGFRWRDLNLSRRVSIWNALADVNAVAVFGIGGLTLGPGGAGGQDVRIARNGGAGLLLIDANAAGATTIQIGATGSAATVESVDAAFIARSRRVAAGAGDSITLTSGTAVTDGAGGAIILTSGNATRTAAGPFTGGAASITAGNGAGAAASAAPGGAVTLTAGNGGAGSDGAGGDIIIRPGDLAGAGINGVVRFRNAANSRTPDLLPRADTEGNVGTAATRWALVRAVTITSGAYKEEETFKEESFAPEDLLQALAKELDEYDSEGLRNMAKVAMFTGQLVRKKMSDFELRIRALERRLN